MSVYSHTRARFVMFVIGIALLMLSWPSSAIADSSHDATSDNAAYSQLQRSVNRLYVAAINENAELVKTSLDIVEYRFNQLPALREASHAGLQELTEHRNRLRLLLARAEPDFVRLRKEAAALLLAVDALAKPAQPLWHEYRSVLAEDTAELARALKGEAGEADFGSPAAAIAQLRADYETVRTAALLSLSDDLSIQRSDAVLRYATTVLNAVPYQAEQAERLLQPLEEALLSLFPPETVRDEFAIVPAVPGMSWGWTAMMGSFIVTVLTWVGWHRYKAEGYESSIPRTKPSERTDAAERIIERWRRRQ